MHPEGNAFGDIKSQDSEGVNLVFDNSGFLYSSIEITGKEYEVDVILPEIQGVYIVELKNIKSSIFAKVVKL